jgi:ArsR family transcriptional regulator
MSALAPTVDLLHVFGDPTRVRLMALVARHELTVADLVSITDLAQPRISTHMGKLREAGLVRDRREGAMTYYALNDRAMSPAAKRLWELLEKEIDDAVLETDRARCEALLRARAAKAPFPDAVAGQMERHYSPGRTWEATALAFLGLVRLGDVLDLGSGDGTIAQFLAPRARSVTCIDKSERMLSAAKKRLAKADNVRFSLADMHELPFEAQSFDAVLLFNVLTYAEDPPRAIAEATRVLRHDGVVVVVTLSEHAHLEDVTASYGHVNSGFTPAALRKMLARGLSVESCGVVCREKRPPHFEVLVAVARRKE